MANKPRANIDLAGLCWRARYSALIRCRQGPQSPCPRAARWTINIPNHQTGRPSVVQSRPGKPIRMMLEGQDSALRPPARLPGRLTPFVGRQADLEKLVALLRDPAVRLVTISGMGGMGKTALALELISRLQHEYQHGAAFIPLAQLSSREELLPALAQARGVQLPPGGDLQQALLDHLSGLHLLLVLDNFEHLLDEAMLVHDLLLAAPRLKVLVTSREKLNLEAEVLYSLGGMELPRSESLQDSPLSDSMALFVQRAGQVRPSFALDDANAAEIVRLCRLVDGSPLGILLAASGVEHFSPAEILDQAETSLDF